MIEPVNEPKQGNQPTLLDVFYPQAQKVIRDTEKDLGVSHRAARVVNPS